MASLSLLAGAVFDAVKATGVPVVSISIEDTTNQSTWTAQLTPGATPAQRQAAADAIAAFDVSTLPALDAEAQAKTDTQRKLVQALVAYIWRVTHAGVNPTAAQLTTELGTLKQIYKALP